MSTQSENQGSETNLYDGNLHCLPCPSPENTGDRGDHDRGVRFAPNVATRRVPGGVWILRCWTGS